MALSHDIGDMPSWNAMALDETLKETMASLQQRLVQASPTPTTKGIAGIAGSKMTKFHQFPLACSYHVHPCGYGCSRNRHKPHASTCIRFMTILLHKSDPTPGPTPRSNRSSRCPTCRPAPFVGRELQGDVKNTWYSFRWKHGDTM